MTLGRQPYMDEMFCKLHQKFDGTFVDAHATQLDAMYKAPLDEATASTSDPTSIDADKLFYDVAKAKKGTSGTGSFGSSVLSKTSAGSSSSTSTQQQMEAMREKLREELRSELEEQRAADREMLERLDRERAADAEKVLKMQQEMDRMQEMIRQFVQGGGLPTTQ